MSQIGHDIGLLCAPLARLLAGGERRVVFAESCTAGLVAASLAGTAGISEYLCGSAVTYREGTKTRWLGVPPQVLCDYTAVSLPVAERMAVGVLENTPEAHLSVSVTGHLGPHAPAHQDGLIYIGTALRSRQSGAILGVGVYEHRLVSSERADRQREAAACVLNRLRELLSTPHGETGRGQLPELPGCDEVVVRMDGCWSRYRVDEPARRRPAVLFPGAFNPLHRGHQRIIDLAAGAVGVQVHCEIAVENVDKPPLTAQDIQQRVAQFPDGQTLWLTRSPTFLDKARFFPGTTFLVGADTVSRIADSVYYGDDPGKRDQAIQELAELGCRFLVYGRLLRGQFATLDNLDLPESLRRISHGVSADCFREDIASTELRRQADQDR